MLTGFGFERVMQTLTDRSGTTTTPLALYRQWFDTQNPKPGLAAADAPHCDDFITDGGRLLMVPGLPENLAYAQLYNAAAQQPLGKEFRDFFIGALERHHRRRADVGLACHPERERWIGVGGWRTE